jgi:hypothetical protein
MAEAFGFRPKGGGMDAEPKRLSVLVFGDWGFAPNSQGQMASPFGPRKG